MTKERYIILTISLMVVIIFLSVLIGQWMGLRQGREVYEKQIRQQVKRIDNIEQGESGEFQQMVIDLMENKIVQTCAIVENNYIEQIDIDSLAERIIPLVLEELDPHSTYIPKRDMQAFNEPLEGEFDGIGIVFNAATDTVVVLNVVAKGPSEKAGLLSGDRIIQVNDTLIAGVQMPQESIVKRLRGKRGTSVRLKIKRYGVEDLVDVEVVRDAIPLHSIGSSFMITDKIGFIQLSQFSMTTYKEFNEALDKLREQGAEALILDVRSNSGGYLDQAILLANEFLPRNKLIVYTTGRDHQEQLRQYSDGTGRAQDMPVAVLIDEYSASASEIVAGALQDNDRGVIVGRRSFGKGLVQNQLYYPDGSAVRLTVAQYHTPTGRCIQRPYEKGHSEEYYLDILRRYENNELFSLDSIHFADSLKYTTPAGRTVYGGGGIMPDLFIPLDTTYMSNYFSEVSGRNILYRYTLDYTDRNRAKIDRVKSMAELDRLLEGDEMLMEHFYDYAEKQGVQRNAADIKKSGRVMEAQVKAYVGRNSKMEDNAFYHFIYPIDETLSAAVKVLRDSL